MWKRLLKNLAIGVAAVAVIGAVAFGVASGLGLIPGAFFTFGEMTGALASAATAVGEFVAPAFSALGVSNLGAATMGYVTAGIGAATLGVFGGAAKTAIEEPPLEEVQAERAREARSYTVREAQVEAAGIKQARKQQQQLRNAVRQGNTISNLEREVAAGKGRGEYIKAAGSNVGQEGWIAKALENSKGIRR